MKFTDQRYMVLKFLFNNKGHYECEDIIAEFKKRKMQVSRATIYRTLDILVKYNFARKLVLDDGVARYENKINSPHHDHMICVDTGKIIEFECPEIEDLQDSIAKKHGYEIWYYENGNTKSKALYQQGALIDGPYKWDINGVQIL